jgi:hypothetical protein
VDDQLAVVIVQTPLQRKVPRRGRQLPAKAGRERDEVGLARFLEVRQASHVFRARRFGGRQIA